MALYDRHLGTNQACTREAGETTDRREVGTLLSAEGQNISL